MKINLETKFSKGDKVYRIEWKRALTVCEVCNGEGKVILGPASKLGSSKELKCPECNGKGKVDNKGHIWSVVKGTWEVESIFICYVDEFEVSYNLLQRFGQGGCGTSSYEHSCFATEKEALDECERRNSDPEIDWKLINDDDLEDEEGN